MLAYTKNLVWLRTVLASRGLPTVILGCHLRAIAEALAVEFPEDTDMPTRYEPFLASLEAERRAMDGGATLAGLVQAFDLRFQACAGLQVASAAELIASAWRDERAGILGARSATCDWFGDEARFSPEWVANVAELLARLDHNRSAAC